MNPVYGDFRKRVEVFDFAPCTTCNSCEMGEGNEEDCYSNTRPACGAVCGPRDLSTARKYSMPLSRKPQGSLL